jgi:hypothetical protein
MAAAGLIGYDVTAALAARAVHAFQGMLIGLVSFSTRNATCGCVQCVPVVGICQVLSNRRMAYAHPLSSVFATITQQLQSRPALGLPVVAVFANIRQSRLYQPSHKGHVMPEQVLLATHPHTTAGLLNKTGSHIGSQVGQLAAVEVCQASPPLNSSSHQQCSADVSCHCLHT